MPSVCGVAKEGWDGGRGFEIGAACKTASQVGKEVSVLTSVTAHGHAMKRVSELVSKRGVQRLVSTVGQLTERGRRRGYALKDLIKVLPRRLDQSRERSARSQQSRCEVTWWPACCLSHGVASEDRRTLAVFLHCSHRLRPQGCVVGRSRAMVHGQRWADADLTVTLTRRQRLFALGRCCCGQEGVCRAWIGNYAGIRLYRPDVADVAIVHTQPPPSAVERGARL